MVQKLKDSTLYPPQARGKEQFRDYLGNIRAEVQEALSQFEQVEDGSWKALNGTGYSIILDAEFYLELLPKLASRSSLHLRFLKLDGKATAYEIVEIGSHYCLHNTSFVNGFDEYSLAQHLL